jgi:peptide/nickel transport system ATP-binding protein
MSERLLQVSDLLVTTLAGDPVLDHVSVSVGRGESIGLVGESGSGKTALAHAMLGFARPGLRLSGGSVRIAGEELLTKSETDLRALRGRKVSYVPQDPATSLNPSMRIGDQLREICHIHGRQTETEEIIPTVLGRVDLPSDRQFQRRFPHQLSGGQKQRVAIAIALACDPPLIVLDEPTTGLDVVTQAVILQEVRRIQRELDVSLVYVSHDLAAVAAVADRVIVMYAGSIVESAATDMLVARPRHPYSRGLVSSVPDHRRARRLRGIPGVAPAVDDHPVGCVFGPRCELFTDACAAEQPSLVALSSDHWVRCIRSQDTPPPTSEPRLAAPRIAADMKPILRVQELVADYRSRGIPFTAVDRVSFIAQPGECLALVGESGSGKTTIARCIVGLHQPSGGTIAFDSRRLQPSARRRSLEQRRRIQIVFQNPYESLNPKRTIRDAVSWPARALRGCSRQQAEQEVATLLDRVRLPAGLAQRYPGELSGGERQRVAIARALAARPDLLVCDEVTSALDVSVQAATLDLLRELQTELSLTMLFITHDLGVVASVADRVIVLERGSLQEEGDVLEILRAPAQPYTRRLVEAAPSLMATENDLPSPADVP